MAKKNTRYQVAALAGVTHTKFTSEGIAEDAPGSVRLFSCNDALARGAIEAGVRVAAVYPGAPVTYVLENLATAARQFPEMHVEWSANEKCSYEAALGAAMCGVRALCALKNVGMNWIVDPLMSSSLMGAGGLVVIVADDAGSETSHVEQDSRGLALFAEVPVVEPAGLQQAKDMVPYAFELSERLNIPVVVRLTVRLGYSRGAVELGTIRHEVRRRTPRFERSLTRGWTNFPTLTWPETGPTSVHQRYHGEVPAEILPLMRQAPTRRAIEEAADECPFTRVRADAAPVALVTAGFVETEVREALQEAGLEDTVTLVTLGVTHPIPAALCTRLLREKTAVLVVEELEPIVENQVRALASELPAHARVLGKRNRLLPHAGEITAEHVAGALAALLETAPPAQRLVPERLEAVRRRVPFRIGGKFCAGCPEVAPTLALRHVIDALPHEVVTCGDAGCGFIAAVPPISLLDTFVCMGAGLGVAHGMFHAGLDARVAAVMGDSTFFHSGIVELINAVYNRSDVTLLILDNKSTAETGQQPNPGAFGITAMREPTKELVIEDLVRACQVDFLKVVDAYDSAGLEDALREGLAIPGVAVVIARGACALIVERHLKQSRTAAPAPLPVA